MSNSSDFFKKFQPLFEAKDDDKNDKKDEKKKEKIKSDKKANNVKESATDFFRKYADIIVEAESDDDEDPDVAIADKVKGKDKKNQKDADKDLPPWLKGKLDKKDKDAEDKGAKKAAKDLTEDELDRYIDSHTKDGKRRKDAPWTDDDFDKMPSDKLSFDPKVLNQVKKTVTSKYGAGNFYHKGNGTDFSWQKFGPGQDSLVGPEYVFRYDPSTNKITKIK